MVIWMSWIILDLENYKFSCILRLHGSDINPKKAGFDPVYQPEEHGSSLILGWPVSCHVGGEYPSHLNPPPTAEPSASENSGDPKKSQLSPFGIGHWYQLRLQNSSSFIKSSLPTGCLMQKLLHVSPFMWTQTCTKWFKQILSTNRTQSLPKILRLPFGECVLDP